MSDLTHFEDGKAVMVDVSDKDVTTRTAIARGTVTMNETAFEKLSSGTSKKGDVLGVARIAGIMAAKKTSDLIPLCHPLSLSKVTIDFTLDESSRQVALEATVKTDGKTGVEMEALTAVSVSTLTIYDMLKAVDKAMEISDIALHHKTGGKSGDFDRTNESGDKKTSTEPKAKARPSEVPLHPPHITQPMAAGKRESLQRFMADKRLKPLKWAKQAGIEPGILYQFLQGRSGSLPAEAETKLAAAIGTPVAAMYDRKQT